MKKHKDIDTYVAEFPLEIQEICKQLRVTIRKAAPEAEDIISYGMPAFKQNRTLVYFAVCKNHIGFYPTSSGIREFKHEFKDYKWSKGAVQFPLSKPMPYKLIARIVKFRAGEDFSNTKTKTKKK